MTSSAPSGQVLAAGISVLPATGAYALLSQSQVESLYSTIVTIIGLWALSYVGVALALKVVKK
jgi:hypothetical protein